MKENLKKDYEAKIQKMSRELRELELLLRSQELINSTIHLDTVLDYLMQLAVKITDCEAASALLLEGDRLYFASASGVKTSQIKGV